MADPIFKELAYAALAQTARNPIQDFLRATPRDPVLGYLADLAASSYAPQRTQQMQGIAQFFGAPAVSQTLDRLSYGEPLTTGAGGLGGTTRIRPEAIEAAMIAAPFVGKAAKATKGLPVGMSIKDVSPPQDLLTSINPTGSVFTKYTPELRASQPLAKNITTLDKTTGLNPDEFITIYRGAPSNQKTIAPGDFITDNPQLAKDYAGSGKVLQMKVRRGDVLDDLDDPLGGEYIYRPNATFNLSDKQLQAMMLRDIGTDLNTIYKQTGIWLGE